MKKFNVFVWDFNKDMIEPYDILPYFRRCLDNRIERSKEHDESEYYKVPSTFEDFKEFVRKESLYQFWGRCEYEMIVHGWPVQKNDHKLDVHEQIMLNIDTIAEILFNEYNNK